MNKQIYYSKLNFAYAQIRKQSFEEIENLRFSKQNKSKNKK